MPSTAVRVRPLGDRIVVRLVDAKERHGSIIIPDTAKEKPQEGEVIAVGPGRRLDSGTFAPPEVKKGDRVLFGKYSGNEIALADDKYLMLRESDLLAIL